MLSNSITSLFQRGGLFLCVCFLALLASCSGDSSGSFSGAESEPACNDEALACKDSGESQALLLQIPSSIEIADGGQTLLHVNQGLEEDESFQVGFRELAGVFDENGVLIDYTLEIDESQRFFSDDGLNHGAGESHAVIKPIPGRTGTAYIELTLGDQSKIIRVDVYGYNRPPVISTVVRLGDQDVSGLQRRPLLSAADFEAFVGEDGVNLPDGYDLYHPDLQPLAMREDLSDLAQDQTYQAVFFVVDQRIDDVNIQFRSRTPELIKSENVRLVGDKQILLSAEGQLELAEAGTETALLVGHNAELESGTVKLPVHVYTLEIRPEPNRNSGPVDSNGQPINSDDSGSRYDCENDICRPLLAQIDIQVDDGEFQRVSTFYVDIQPQNDGPVIESIGSLNFKEDQVREVPLMITDVDDSLASLDVQLVADLADPNSGRRHLFTSANSVSNNTAIALGLVANANTTGDEVLDGGRVSGSYLNLDASEDNSLEGVEQVFLTVSDGENQTSQLLTVTVEAVNDAPFLLTDSLSNLAGESFATISDIPTLAFKEPVDIPLNLPATADVRTAVFEVFDIDSDLSLSFSDGQAVTEVGGRREKLFATAPIIRQPVVSASGKANTFDVQVEFIPSDENVNGLSPYGFKLSDGERSARAEFNVLIEPANDTPRFVLGSAPVDIEINEGGNGYSLIDLVDVFPVDKLTESQLRELTIVATPRLAFDAEIDPASSRKPT